MLEGVVPLSAEDSSPVDLRVLFLPDGLSVASEVDSPLVPCVVRSPLGRGEVCDSPDLPYPRFPDLGDAVAFASAGTVAEAAALGAALGDPPVEALGDAEAPGEADALAPGDAVGKADAPP